MTRKCAQCGEIITGKGFRKTPTGWMHGDCYLKCKSSRKDFVDIWLEFFDSNRKKIGVSNE